MVTPASRAARFRDDLRRVALVALCGVLILLPVALLLGRPPQRPQLTLLGNGDSVSLLLEGAGGGRVVIGGGAGQADLAAALGRQLWPWDRQVDLLVVADVRDLNGAAELVRRGIARSVATVGLTEQRGAAALATLREACAARRVPLRAIESAERIAIGRGAAMALTVAPPERAGESPAIRLRMGVLEAPAIAGTSADDAPALGAILLRANQESYRLAAATGARLIAAPQPPAGSVVAAPEGRHLLILRAGDRATLAADDRRLRLRGVPLVPLDAAAPPR